MKRLLQSLASMTGHRILRSDTAERLLRQSAQFESRPEVEVAPMLPALDGPAAAPAPAPGEIYTSIFHHDGLWTDPKVIHNHDFMRDQSYVRAYQAGAAALGLEHRMFWRLHVALWCAKQASRLEGDFVECGVLRGFLSTAIITHLDWESLEKTFYLFDTFDGLVSEQLSATEKKNVEKIEHLNRHFRNSYDFAREHFARFPRVKLCRGVVTDTLNEVTIGKVAYLSIDMNCAYPEIAAAEFFWDKVVPGGVILLDDYGFVSYEDQKRAFDEFARQKGISILALPTGQGLMMKTP